MNIKDDIRAIKAEVENLKDLVRAALAPNKDVTSALGNCRKAAEAICKAIYRKLKGEEWPKKEKTLDPLICAIQDAIPQMIVLHLRTIQNYSNKGAHDQGPEENKLLDQEAIKPCLDALSEIVAWFAEKYDSSNPDFSALYYEIKKTRESFRSGVLILVVIFLVFVSVFTFFRTHRDLETKAEAGDPVAQVHLANEYEAGKNRPKDPVKAAFWLQRAAEQGSMDGMARLGECYFWGRGLPIHYGKALNWSLKSSEQPISQNTLGLIHRLGRGVPANEEEGLKWLEASARQRHPNALYNLGWMYIDGTSKISSDTKRGIRYLMESGEIGFPRAYAALGDLFFKGNQVPKNLQQAERYYRLAAEGGHSDAQFMLGFMYHEGMGVQQNFGEAFHWYGKAAEQGHSRAMHNVGAMYCKGEGVPVDYRKADEWYKKAINAGNLFGYISLGTMYRRGFGVPRNLEEAFRNYEIAAEAGEPEGQTIVGECYLMGEGVPKSYDAAAKWFRFAADKQHPRAQNHLGLMYCDGRGVQRDPKEAFRLFEAAAKQGERDAEMNIARMYLFGIGVPRNQEKAFRIFSRNSEQNSYACLMLGKIYLFGLGVEKNFQKAVEFYLKVDPVKHPAVLYHLGYIYEHGLGVASDFAKALNCYRKAAEADHYIGKFNYGLSLFNGIGGNVDQQKGVRWILNAAKAGYGKAIRYESLFYFHGLGVQKDMSESYAWFLVFKNRVTGHSETNEMVHEEGNSWLDMTNTQYFYKYKMPTEEDYKSLTPEEIKEAIRKSDVYMQNIPHFEYW